MNEPSKGIAKTIKLAERRVFSQSFKPLYQEGMGLVEQAAEYLDGKGRLEAKKLSRMAATLYAAESMRLTTRLMQVASWLLLQRAANSGEMTRDQVGAPARFPGAWADWGWGYGLAVRRSLVGEMGPNAQVVFDVVPGFERLIGPIPLAARLNAVEAQHRFNLVFRRLVRVLAGPSRPLVIFLDDLQCGLARVRRALDPTDRAAATRGSPIVNLHKLILVASAFVVVWAVLFKVH